MQQMQKPMQKPMGGGKPMSGNQMGGEKKKSSMWMWIIIIVAVLVILGVGAYFLGFF
jgi:flagellar basal body-associated protein FliL